MPAVTACPLPDGALLGRYQQPGTFTDCYVTTIARPVTHADYVLAFYTTPVFKLERLILAWAINKPSTDDEAAQLAAGTRDTFAAWRVEDRSDHELLLADLQGRTRSWLMVSPAEGLGANDTRLYFGSAVVPREERGEKRPGAGYRALLGFHKLYSVVLLHAARRQIEARRA